MKASSGTKRPPTGQHPLQPVVDRLHKINKKHPGAVLSLRENQTLNPDTVDDLKARRGGLLGRVLNPFSHRRQFAEGSTQALNFLLKTLDMYRHSLSPEIAKQGRQQLEQLLQQPLGKGLPVQEALNIYQDMLQRQLHQCSDAAARARSADEAYRQRFDDQRQQPPQRPSTPVLAPDHMAHNAQTLSDAYRDAAGKASRGEPDAGPPPANPQAGALGQLAPLLQILQTAIDSPDGHRARQLQDVWEGLACPQDIEEAFTPLRFSRHVQTLLQSCSDALQALKRAQSDGDLREMRTCCEGYAACFEQLIGDLTAAARDLLGAVADGQLPAGLPTPDSVFLLDLGETLLAAAKALADSESPSMANHQSALALLARDDAQLRTVLQHWSRPHRLDQPPGAPLPAQKPRVDARTQIGKRNAPTPPGMPIRRPLGQLGQYRIKGSPIDSGDERTSKPDVPMPPLVSAGPSEKAAPTDPVGSFDDQVEDFLNDMEARQTSLPGLESVTSFVNSPRRGPAPDTEEHTDALRRLVDEELENLLVQMEEGRQPKPMGSKSMGYGLGDPAPDRQRAFSVPAIPSGRATQSTNPQEPTDEKPSRLQRVTRQLSNSWWKRSPSKSGQ
ncbi:hypothetical protein JNX00_16945 [Hydrogenophaga sp. YM1]|uniref:hypothetical protein n=1 Tax=Hydrogenophaga sp. YM1 TaxID=2806262 RepID=UPI00195A0FFD|nr:hypothetical protein [Hydrogenophaga sp. YM1]QRR33318.1 hypothetical protein JNX00_16945 [Hydrogenophaga sp. YM1]